MTKTGLVNRLPTLTSGESNGVLTKPTRQFSCTQIDKRSRINGHDSNFAMDD